MPDVAFRRFAGINNVDPAERLNATVTRESDKIDLTDAVNVDIDNAYRVARRAGQTLLIPGDAHSLWAQGGYCLYVQGDMMYNLAPDLTATPVAGGLSADPVAYVLANERVYHSNGYVTGVLDEGRVRAWGIDITGPAADSLRAFIQPGPMPAGAYQFAMTFIRDDDQESGTGLAKIIDMPEGGALLFCWDVPNDASITHCIIYLSAPNGQTLFKAIKCDVELGQILYRDGPRSLPLATQWYDAPPPGQCLAEYKGRIYIGKGSYLYATVAFGYEYCDMRDYLTIDGTAIRFIAAVQHGLFVGTERQVYFLTGDSLGEFVLKSVIDAPGIAGSVVIADADIVTGEASLAGQQGAVFATGVGIYLGLDDGSVMNLTHPRYRYNSAARAAAVFRDEPERQCYLLTPQP